ncbi:hypothetical protein DH2020_049557 [Rehmannia glutinosa]|uniref:F-box associated beta-propeller type 3 domain-containing protein n=1 Tax=Rehmannia glutinosa TaxID=99300 RepID=A0ABR0U2F8_REHGL
MDAGASSNDTKPRAMRLCRVRGSITWNGDAKRRHRLLAEFLRGSQNRLAICVQEMLTLLGPGRSYFHVMDLDHGKDRFIESGLADTFDVRASCDGLVLATMEKKLILMNPVTRRHVLLPLGEGGNFGVETFGVVFCNEVKTYKVVWFFRERSGCTSCDILNISTRKWTKMDGLSSELIGDIKQILVSIDGSLYWKLREHSCDCFVSMNVDDEKFSIKKLPISCGVTDRLIEIGGNLGLVTHDQELNLLQVWILMINDGGLRGNWTKSYNIGLNVDVAYPLPICSTRNGKEMVFENLGQHYLYVYNFDKDEMRLVYARDDDDDAWYERIDKLYIPHRNTLVSWEDHTS